MDDFFPFSDEEIQESMHNNSNSLLLDPHHVSDPFTFGDPFESLNSSAVNSNEQNVLNELVEKDEPTWEHVKWTTEMARVLITAVSYIGHDGLYDGRIKGKWRIISNAMVERGCPVSPQQCEDKFNDLNKKYKKMRDLLEGNSFDIVENHNLMELANIPEKSKDDIKKLLTCKQLLYREMCSFHDGDKKYLPHDEILENSVRLALKGKRVKNKLRDMVSRVVRQKNNGENSDFFGGFVHEGREEMMSRFLQLEEEKLQMQNKLFELEKRSSNG